MDGATEKRSLKQQRQQKKSLDALLAGRLRSFTWSTMLSYSVGHPMAESNYGMLDPIGSPLRSTRSGDCQSGSPRCSLGSTLICLVAKWPTARWPADER
ncbi:Uncharacterized protein TCM_031779 [Theobroma cacao]|uniref:Uncharacterized protein n=1 Tax=Theobroma cacao TaxID=3641 RepID=A0A061F997_THECC|nr:Uncharacterized protein TCM_031779 [Theobroma cacao]